MSKSPARGTLRVFADGETLARETAAWLTDRALRARGWFTLSLSGGTTPKRLYEIMAASPVRERFPWALTRFAFGDERFVPQDDPASNARMARQAMFAHVPVAEWQIHAMPTVGLSPEAATAQYERTLKILYGDDTIVPERPLFDVTLLGLGDDGHTASLLPGQPVLQERTRWVGVVAQGRPETRLTLTYPALESSGAVVFLVQGKGKRAILNRVLSGDDTIPAGSLRPRGELLWFADRAAAGDWAQA
jgi:6-phosphogluconolactonase